MRLINAQTLQLEHFMVSPPPYAILSHTWEAEEVTLQEFAGSERSAVSKKRGFAKIERTCRQARQDGLGYAWVDTCCIDKTSSAELSEAINSMFAWYAASAVCYVFLADVWGDNDDERRGPATRQALSGSRWFTRGWTLQELIASPTVRFYGGAWTFRGTKEELSDALSAITGVDVEVLRNNSFLHEIPVARRMSWAAHRSTTRPEDMTGSKAFRRLQEEIVKQTNDLSLLAWTIVPFQKYSGVLADSPAAFANAGAIVAGDDLSFNEEFVLTNKGLRIKTGIQHMAQPIDTSVLPLNCRLKSGDNIGTGLGILVRKLGSSTFVRSHPDLLVEQRAWELKDADTIYLARQLTARQAVDAAASHREAVVVSRDLAAALIRVKPVELWDSQRQMFLTWGLAEFQASLALQLANLRHLPDIDGLIGSVNIGFGLRSDASGNRISWVVMASPSEDKELTQAVVSLKATEETLRLHGQRTVRLKQRIDMIYRSRNATVTMEESEMDGERVYLIDLHLDEI